MMTKKEVEGFANLLVKKYGFDGAMDLIDADMERFITQLNDLEHQAKAEYESYEEWDRHRFYEIPMEIEKLATQVEFYVKVSRKIREMQKNI